MDSSFILGVTTLTYLFSTVLYLIVFLFKSNKVGVFATWFTLASFIFQTFGVCLRWYESYKLGFGHAPLTNMYESLVFFSWTIIALYLYLEFKYKVRTLGIFIVPFAFLSMAYGSLAPEINRDISPLIPALQSNWLISHVVTCFIGYAAFALAAGMGIMYLAKSAQSDNKKQSGLLATLPELPVIDDIIHKTMIFGFIWLSGGIITGAVWANSAWGTYWSWDPKETWSLITWFFYAITLHARYTRGLNGKVIAWLAVIGLIFVLFTYYGVNFLLSGLHSYGSQ